MADDLLVTDAVLEDPEVLRRLLSDIIERLSDTVQEVIDPVQTQQTLTIINNSTEGFFETQDANTIDATNRIAILFIIGK